MAEAVCGPSGGALGKDGGIVTREVWEEHPDMARQFVTIGRHQRTGHNRERWKTLDWDDYRARVGLSQSAGPWRIEPIESRPGDVTSWVAEAEGMPATPPGWYTALMHRDRGLIMCDLPGEIAGMLTFLDTVKMWMRPQVLIAGLGLGIVPAWLLTSTTVARIDVIEIDPDVIDLITRDHDRPHAVNAWAGSQRLHIHQADAHTWRPRNRRGCSLHTDCALSAGATWQAAFYDIWDTISPANLPSMQRLTRHYARRTRQSWSWERAECEAMRRRGQTLERPGCLFISETGYPAISEPGEVTRA